MGNFELTLIVALGFMLGQLGWVAILFLLEAPDRKRRAQEEKKRTEFIKEALADFDKALNAKRPVKKKTTKKGKK